MASKSFQFFSQKTERLFLAVPYLLVILFAALIFTFPVSVVANKKMLTLLASIVLLDVPHTVLSWTMLRLPELRDWKLAYNKKRSFFVSLFLVFAFFVFAFSAESVSISFQAGESSNLKQEFFHWFYFFMGWAVSILMPHHVCSQFKGISYIYNYLAQKNHPGWDLKSTRQVCRLENVGFWFLIVGASVAQAQILRLAPIKNSMLLSPVAFVSMILGCAIVFYASFKLPKSEQIKKRIFLARIFLFPVMQWNVLGGLCLQALHGIEYTFICTQMIENSKEQCKKNIFIQMMLTMFFISVLFLIFTFRHILLENLEFPIALSLLALVLTRANTYTHYWFDGVLFKMREPILRRCIEPLLYKAKNTDLQIKKSHTEFKTIKSA